MDRKQKIEQLGCKNNVNSIRHKDRKVISKEDALKQDYLQNKAMFEVLGENLNSNIKGGKTYCHQEYLNLKAMADKHGIPD